MVHDDQKPQIVAFVSEIMEDPAAAQYVWGAVWIFIHYLLFVDFSRLSIGMEISSITTNI